MAARQMNFNITNMLFFSINNTIHDTMHDYRDKDRWINSIIQLNLFRGGGRYSRMINPRRGDSTKENQIVPMTPRSQAKSNTRFVAKNSINAKEQRSAVVMASRATSRAKGPGYISKEDSKEEIAKIMHIDMQFNAFDLNLSNPGLNMFNMTIRDFLSLDYNNEADVLFSLLDQSGDVFSIIRDKTKNSRQFFPDNIPRSLINLTYIKFKIISLYLSHIYNYRQSVISAAANANAAADVVAASETAFSASDEVGDSVAESDDVVARQKYQDLSRFEQSNLLLDLQNFITADLIEYIYNMDDKQQVIDSISEHFSRPAPVPAPVPAAASEMPVAPGTPEMPGTGIRLGQGLGIGPAVMLTQKKMDVNKLIEEIKRGQASRQDKQMKGGSQSGNDVDLSSANNNAIISLIQKAIDGKTPSDLLSTFYNVRNGGFNRISNVDAYLPKNLKLNALILFLTGKSQAAMVANIKARIEAIVNLGGQSKDAVNYDYKKLLNEVKDDFTQYRDDAEARELAAAQAAQAAAAQAVAAAAAVAAQKAADAAALAVAGQWSNMIHGSLKENFLQTFIKMGLINHKVYNFPADSALPDEDLPMNPIFAALNPTTSEQRLLMAQIKILLSSSYLLFPNNQVQNNNWRQLALVGSNLDDKLYNYFAANFNTVDAFNLKNDNNQSIQVQAAHNNMQFIVNNAAPLPDYLNGHEFCPLSSRKDGQSNCNEQSATILETGNMDFTILNNNADADFPVASLFYRGQSSQYPLVAGAPGRTTRYNINLGFGPGNTTQIEEDLVYNGKELTAAQAIKMTLQKFWNFTQGAQGAAVHAAVIAQIAVDKAAAAAAAGGAAAATFGYFDLFYRQSYNTPAARAEFQECMYRILFKNTGDLFQEINAVCKFGGYINNAANPIRYDGNIIQWSPTGDAKRLFLAQDQPSACRFIFLKKYGVPAETNSGAFGGFWGQEKKMIYYHGGANAQEYAGGRNTGRTKKNRLIKQTKKNRLIIRKKQRQTKKRNQ